jgi:hypothetical protein
MICTYQIATLISIGIKVHVFFNTFVCNEKKARKRVVGIYLRYLNSNKKAEVSLIVYKLFSQAIHD